MTSHKEAMILKESFQEELRRVKRRRRRPKDKKREVLRKIKARKARAS